MTQQSRPDPRKKSNLKQSSRFSDQSQAQYSDYSSPSRVGRARETASDESNLEEYQIEGKNLTSVLQPVLTFPRTDIEREIQRRTPESEQQHYRGGVGESSGNRR